MDLDGLVLCIMIYLKEHGGCGGGVAAGASAHRSCSGGAIGIGDIPEGAFLDPTRVLATTTIMITHHHHHAQWCLSHCSSRSRRRVVVVVVVVVGVEVLWLMPCLLMGMPCLPLRVAGSSRLGMPQIPTLARGMECRAARPIRA